MASESAILSLLQLPGIGPVRANRILSSLRTNHASLIDALGSDTTLRSFLDDRQRRAYPAIRERADKDLEQVREMGGDVITVSDGRYPRRLKDLLGENTPSLLFVLGNIDLLTKVGVGFCGSRHASPKGLSTATDCADQLARKGLNIVSGYAAGVDTAVHKVAFASGGTTTIVLAEGLLRFRLKAEISEEWNAKKAVVLSEFAPESPWAVTNAMQRNKTICALSRAMVLIEAGSKGGSLAAGKACLAMGIPLFAAVYEGMPITAAGNNQLLTEGARPLKRSRATGRANVTSILEATS